LTICTGRFIAAANTDSPNASNRSATTDGTSTQPLDDLAAFTATIIAPRLGNQTRDEFATTQANSYNRTNKALLKQAVL
jgi:hypothetical protein